MPVWAALAAVCGAAPLTQEGLAKLSAPASVLAVSPLVTANSGAAIEADVSGLAEIALITWTGGDASPCDYADWLEVRFEGDGGAVDVSDLPW